MKKATPEHIYYYFCREIVRYRVIRETRKSYLVHINGTDYFFSKTDRFVYLHEDMAILAWRRNQTDKVIEGIMAAKAIIDGPVIKDAGA